MNAEFVVEFSILQAITIQSLFLMSITGEYPIRIAHKLIWPISKEMPPKLREKE